MKFDLSPIERPYLFNVTFYYMDFEIKIEVWTHILGFLPYKKGEVKLCPKDEQRIISKVRERLETKFNGILPKFKYYIMNYYNRLNEWETISVQGWRDYIEQNQLETV